MTARLLEPGHPVTVMHPDADGTPTPAAGTVVDVIERPEPGVVTVWVQLAPAEQYGWQPWLVRVLADRCGRGVRITPRHPTAAPCLTRATASASCR